jgi:hypothetical protein
MDIPTPTDAQWWHRLEAVSSLARAGGLLCLTSKWLRTGLGPPPEIA